MRHEDFVQKLYEVRGEPDKLNALIVREHSRLVNIPPATETHLEEFRVGIMPDPKCPPHILEYQKRQALATYLADLPVKWEVRDDAPDGQKHEARIFYVRGEK